MTVDKYSDFSLSCAADGDVSVSWTTDTFINSKEKLQLFGMNLKMYECTQKWDNGKYSFSYTFMPNYTFVLKDMEVDTEEGGYTCTGSPQSVLTDILGSSGITGTTDTDTPASVTFQSRKTNRLALLIEYASFIEAAIRPVGDGVKLIKDTVTTFDIGKVFEYSHNLVNGDRQVRFSNKDNYFIQPGDKVIWAGIPEALMVWAVDWNPFDASRSPTLTLDRYRYTLEAQDYEEKEKEEEDEKIPPGDYDKPNRYLKSDKSNYYWIEYENTTENFVCSECQTALAPIQHTNSSGQKYYWTDSTYKKMTIKQTGYIVYVYQYEDKTYATLAWETVGESTLPAITLTNDSTDGMTISPAGAVDGFSISNGSFSLDWDGNRLKSVGDATGLSVSNTVAQDSEPDDAQEGDIWVDTTSVVSERYPAYIYHNSEWLQFGGGDIYNETVYVNRVDLFTPMSIEYGDSGIEVE